MDDELYITRNEHEEFRLRLEQEDKRLNARMEVVEKKLDSYTELAISVQRIAMSCERTTKELESQGTRLKTLEDRDGEKWRSAVGYIVTAFLGVFLGYVFQHIGVTPM